MLHLEILLTATCTVYIVFENAPPWTCFKVFHQMIIATTKYICLSEEIMWHIKKTYYIFFPSKSKSLSKIYTYLLLWWHRTMVSCF